MFFLTPPIGLTVLYDLVKKIKLLLKKKKENTSTLLCRYIYLKFIYQHPSINEDFNEYGKLSIL